MAGLAINLEGFEEERSESNRLTIWLGPVVLAGQSGQNPRWGQAGPLLSPDDPGLSSTLCQRLAWRRGLLCLFFRLLLSKVLTLTQVDFQFRIQVRVIQVPVSGDPSVIPLA